MINSITYSQNKNTMVILLGFILGLLLFFSPGSVFIFSVALLVLFFINRIGENDERRFLSLLFSIALSSRIIVSLLSMFIAIYIGKILNYAHMGYPDYSTPYLVDDSGYYTLRGLFNSMYWLNKPMHPITIEAMVTNPYGATGYIYLLATFFTLFGYSPIASRFINCLLGALIAILIYSIVRNIFGKKPAVLSSILVAFWPSLFFWSITNLKETSLIFLAYLMIWSAIKFHSTKRFYYLILISLSILAQFSIRRAYIEFIYLNVIIVLLYFLLVFILNLYRKKRFFFIAVSSLASLFFILIFKENLYLLFSSMLQKAIVFYQGTISEGGIYYQFLSTEQPVKLNMGYLEFLTVLSKAWTHMLLEPFPWRFIHSKSIFLTMPQMLLWYFLMPFFAIGALISVRYRLRQASILFLYFFIIASALAITGANIGTIFRFRDIVTPVVLVFSSIGLIYVFNPSGLDLTKDSINK